MTENPFLETEANPDNEERRLQAEQEKARIDGRKKAAKRDAVLYFVLVPVLPALGWALSLLFLSDFATGAPAMFEVPDLLRFPIGLLFIGLMLSPVWTLLTAVRETMLYRQYCEYAEEHAEFVAAHKREIEPLIDGNQQNPMGNTEN